MHSPGVAMNDRVLSLGVGFARGGTVVWTYDLKIANCSLGIDCRESIGIREYMGLREALDISGTYGKFPI